MKFKLTIAALIGVVVLGWVYSGNTVRVQNTLIYHLMPGSNLHQTADKLEDLAYIKSAFLMIALAKLQNLEQLKAGYYQLSPDMKVGTLLHNFAFGKVATATITLVEGKTVHYYYQQLSHHLALKKSGDFAETMLLSGAVKPYEGRFWADTYQVNYGDSIASVFSRAAQIMETKLANAWQNRPSNYPLKTANQALILASLIEKETAYNAEKPRIAAVFINRLANKMRLQADPSVIYALGTHYKGRLSKQDLRYNSPYNTYKIKGLPPSAINSVGQESLHAALHPAKTNALYFVAKKDGSHIFSNTYQQHKNNIKKYLK